MSRNWPPRRRRAPLESVTGFHENLSQSAIDIFAADASPVTSSDLDTREAPTCACGAPVYRAGLCVRHDEDEAEKANRALPPHLQRD